MKKKHDIMLDVAKIASTRYLTRALLFVKTIVVARWLGPADYGLIGLVLLIPTYGQWTDLGLLGGLVRKLPLLGEGEEARAGREALIKTGMTSYGLLAALVVAGVLMAAFFVDDPKAARCFLFAAFVIPAQCIYNFFQNHHRARQEFGIVARSVAIQELTGLCYTLALVYVMGAQGFFLAMILSHSTANVYLLLQYWRAGAPFGVRWDWRLTLGLLSAGLPLASTTIFHTFFLSLDRLVMSRTTPHEVIGHYMLALLVCGVVQYVPTSVGYILFPVLRERAGGGRADSETLYRYLREPTETIAWVIVFVIAGAVLLLPVIPLILPSYRPGIEPARVLTLFTFFLALNTVARNHLAAIKSYWKSLVGFQAIVTLLTPLVLVLALRMGSDVMGVAFGMGAMYMVYGLGAQVLAAGTCNVGYRRILIDLAYCLIPILYLSLVLLGIDRLLLLVGLEGWRAALAGVVLFVPASIPLFYGVARRTPVLKLLKQAWQARRSVNQEG